MSSPESAGQDVRQPPAKRRRQDSDETPENSHGARTSITRSADVWMQDGNIVLIADKKVAFRVHRGILARHSPVFSDALEIPQPEDVESYDGCPVLGISDLPADVSCLLQALYDGIRFKPLRPRVPAAFVSHAILLELSHKYDIEHLREEAHSRLKSCFPHQFSDLHSTVAFSSKPSAGCILKSSTLEVQESRDAIRAVSLVRLVDDHRMLPMALYLCTQLPVATLLKGIRRPDSERKDTLSRQDLIRCLEARSTLSERAYKKWARIWRTHLTDDCYSPSQCHSIRMAKANAVIIRPAADTPPHPLLSMEDVIRGAGLCTSCVDALMAEDSEEIRLVWEKLPDDFKVEVPEWDSSDSSA
ncbi:hypothetical protein FKP32DRAFT_1671049 [Trametes sanguinea]|nr:hypothetical protein FKP32DRAFT_1671049 [Trametes sanguinea]